MRDANEEGTRGGGPGQVPAARSAVAASGSEPRLQVASQREHEDDEGTSALRPVSADMQQFIGRQLRAVFDDVAKQPVPDRFLELMKQLDSKTGVR